MEVVELGWISVDDRQWRSFLAWEVAGHGIRGVWCGFRVRRAPRDFGLGGHRAVGSDWLSSGCGARLRQRVVEEFAWTHCGLVRKFGVAPAVLGDAMVVTWLIRHPE